MRNIKKTAKLIQDTIASDEPSQHKIKWVNGVPRRTGSSFWMLNAAIDNPHCYLVFDTDECAREYEKHFQWETRHSREIHSKYPVFIGYEKFVELAKSEQGLPSMPVHYDTTVVRMLVKTLEQLKPEPKTFVNELTELVNRYSLENASNTPDFLLAKFLLACFDNYSAVVAQRDKWFGIDPWEKSAEEKADSVNS